MGVCAISIAGQIFPGQNFVDGRMNYPSIFSVRSSENLNFALPQAERRHKTKPSSTTMTTD